MSVPAIEEELKSFLEKVSNGEPVDLPDQVVEEFGEQLKQAVIKQFTPRDPEFKLRPSNLGRPLCVLQREKESTKAPPMPYNHVIRMLMGDCVEAIMRLLLSTAGVNVTSDGDRVKMDISGVTITGESDIDIDGKVYDIKSCSPWAFTNKWAEGYHGLKADDAFGYVGQLYAYADAQKKKPGGWIVVDKSSGELMVVEVDDTSVEASDIRGDRKRKVGAIKNNAPFRRGFEPFDEFFRRKPTGDQILHKTCGFCSFKKECWPQAVYRPSKMSSPDAKKPTHKWFTE